MRYSASGTIHWPSAPRVNRFSAGGPTSPNAGGSSVACGVERVLLGLEEAEAVEEAEWRDFTEEDDCARTAAAGREDGAADAEVSSVSLPSLALAEAAEDDADACRRCLADGCWGCSAGAAAAAAAAAAPLFFFLPMLATAGVAAGQASGRRGDTATRGSSASEQSTHSR